LFALKRLWIFTIGFTIGLLIFISANVLTYYRMIREPPALTDVPTSFGFPFKLHISSGFGGASMIWSGLIADILVAICGSAILGLVAGLVFRK